MANFSRTNILLTCTSAALLACAGTANADDELNESKGSHFQRGPNSFAEAISEGDASISFRLRKEFVGDKAKRDGSALTLQTLLDYDTKAYAGLSGRVEFVDVTPIMDRKLNSGMNTTAGKAKRAQISDPKGSTVTEAYLKYIGLRDTEIVFGRQRIRLDNERFFGSHDFRQNPQTFDAVSFTNHSLAYTTVTYNYIDQVNTIFSNNAKAIHRVHRHHTNLLHLLWTGWEAGDLSAYGYFVDDLNVAANSSNTYGLRFAGAQDVYEISADFALEAARQFDANNNPVDYHADYLALTAGLNFHPAFVNVTYEYLEGDRSVPGKAFQTPFASAHRFLGTADVFLVTPTQGVVDANVSGGTSFQGYDIFGSFHKFVAESGSQRYGNELDLEVKKRFCDHYYFDAALAKFSASDNSGFSDIFKLWFTLGAVF